MTRAEKVAWAAGLFEGEGCFTFAAGGRMGRASVAMTDEDVVNRFAAIVGVGKVTATKPPSRPSHHKQQWVWHVEGEGVRFVLDLFRPFLGHRRLERGEAVAAARAEHIAKSTRTRRCPTCGVDFRPKFGTRSAAQKFCAARCQTLFHARRPTRGGRRLPLTGDAA